MLGCDLLVKLGDYHLSLNWINIWPAIEAWRTKEQILETQCESLTALYDKQAICVDLIMEVREGYLIKSPIQTQGFY